MAHGSRRRLPVLLLPGALVVLIAVGPAQAIETAQFGLDPTSSSRSGPEQPHFRIATRPGETTTGAVVLRNKTATVLALHLSVVPATVDSRGSATLVGDAAPVGWVRLGNGSVALGPHEVRSVAVRVTAPRSLTKAPATVAIVAEPALAPGTSVLQRLALVVYLDPTGSHSSRGHQDRIQSPGRWLVLLMASGAALLALVVAALELTARRRVARLASSRSIGGPRSPDSSPDTAQSVSTDGDVVVRRVTRHRPGREPPPPTTTS